MSLLFKEVPANQISPATLLEIDTNTGVVAPAQIDYKVLAIGQKTSAGTTVAEEIVQATSFDDAVLKFGAGSQLACMAEAYFSVDTSIPFYAMVAEDATSSAAATGTVALAGTATANGTYKLYIGGNKQNRSVSIGVLKDDSAAEIATKIVAAVTANENLAVTASAVTGTVTFTAKNKGTLGNAIVLSENYYDGEETPAGITTTITAMTDGATDPSIQDLVDAIPEDDWYQYVIGGYTLAADVAIIETYLANKYVATQAKSGMYFSALNSITGISALTTYGDSRNSTHSSIMGMYNNISLPCDWAAAMVTAIAPLIAQRQTFNIANIEIPFVAPSKSGYLFNNTEQNQLLGNGISTYNRTSDGLAQVDKLVTTYQLNDAGAPDTNYRNVQSFYTVQYLRYDLDVLMATKYQNYNIVNAGKRQITASNVTTTDGIATTLQNRCSYYEGAVLIEDADTSRESVIVERSLTNTNRVNFRIHFYLAGQLEVIAGQIGFKG